MVDPSRVRRLAELLAEYSNRLAILSTLSKQDFVSEHRYEGRYLVQASAQACIDLAAHVIASEGWRVPGDYRESFTVLRENSIIDVHLEAAMQDLCGLRNRIVHQYGDVDDGMVFDACAAGLRDFTDFAEAMARLIS